VKLRSLATSVGAMAIAGAAVVSLSAPASAAQMRQDLYDISSGPGSDWKSTRSVPAHHDMRVCDATYGLSSPASGGAYEMSYRKSSNHKALWKGPWETKTHRSECHPWVNTGARSVYARISVNGFTSLDEADVWLYYN